MREDFPRSRKGWDPDAVRAHLREVEEEVHAISATSRMSGRAAEGVRRVVHAAEETLAELTVEAQRELERASMEAEAIRAAARAGARTQLAGADGHPGGEDFAGAASVEADRILAGARGEAERIVARAEADASARITEAEAAVQGLIEEARAMGRRMRAFGDELTRDLPARPAPSPGDWGALSAPEQPPRRRFQPGASGGSTPPAPGPEDPEGATALDVATFHA